MQPIVPFVLLLTMPPNYDVIGAKVTYDILGVTETERSEAGVSDSDVQVLLFSAAWCVSCQQVEAELDALRDVGWVIGRERESQICKIDADAAAAELERWQVEWLPTFIRLENGEETARRTGAIDRWEISELYKGYSERPEK